MRSFYYDLQIDNQPVLAPDEDVALTYTDLDADDSGRDESGYMHRIVLRERVMTMDLCYSSLTAEEYVYMDRLLRGHGTFTLTYMDPEGKKRTTTAYCSKTAVVLRCARTGVYKNLKFSIIEC